MGRRRVIMVPDEYLAKNVAAKTGIKIIAWARPLRGARAFSAEDVKQMRDAHPGQSCAGAPGMPAGCP
jgi:quinolinate synthase